jgi:flagellar FliL protein
MATLFYDLPEMLVNLNTKGKQAAYLKLKIALEIDDPATVPKLERLMPRIVDNFQVYLRELRSEDLTGSAGLYRLREELLLRVNTAVAPARISDVLFKEMLVQ